MKIVPKNTIALGLSPAIKKPSLKKESFDLIFFDLDLTFPNLAVKVSYAKYII